MVRPGMCKGGTGQACVQGGLIQQEVGTDVARPGMCKDGTGQACVQGGIVQYDEWNDEPGDREQIPTSNPGMWEGGLTQQEVGTDVARPGMCMGGTGQACVQVGTDMREGSVLKQFGGNIEHEDMSEGSILQKFGGNIEHGDTTSALPVNGDDAKPGLCQGRDEAAKPDMCEDRWCEKQNIEPRRLNEEEKQERREPVDRKGRNETTASCGKKAAWTPIRVRKERLGLNGNLGLSPKSLQNLKSKAAKKQIPFNNTGGKLPKLPKMKMLIEGPSQLSIRAYSNFNPCMTNPTAVQDKDLGVYSGVQCVQSDQQPGVYSGVQWDEMERQPSWDLVSLGRATEEEQILLEIDIAK